MKTNIHILLIITFCLLINKSFSQGKVTILVGSQYYPSKDSTNYMCLPYASVNIPGEWRRTSFNQIDNQQFFKNNENTIISLAFSSNNRYEFNQDGAKEDVDFAYAYYEWDTQFHIEENNYKRLFLECDTLNNYVIYELYKDNSDTIYFRVGTYHHKIVYIYTINKTNKLTETQCINLLKGITLYTKQKRKNKKSKNND